MCPDDTSLIKRAKRGDPAALEEIYEQSYPSIYTYIFYRVGSTELTEDLTAEVFVRLVDKIDTFTQRGRPILAWLYTIARNLVADHHRRAGRMDLLPLEERILPDSAKNPAQIVERHLTNEDLVVALQHLTEAQRQVILLKFFGDHSNKEVGALLDKTEGAVKSLQHRALAALRRVLEREQGYEL